VSERSLIASWQDARPESVWLDSASRPGPRGPIRGATTTDLLVIGGGYSGLWTALLAKERDPGREVVLVESDRIGSAATGRNGGFCEASLTHGEANGRERFPAEFETLDRLGLANLDEMQATVARYGIDCGWLRSGELTVATQAYQVDALRDGSGEFLDREAVRAQVDSPTYLAGSWDRHGAALVDPARLAWGLADACESLGVRICEASPVRKIRRSGGQVEALTPTGVVTARQVALATNAFPSLLRRLRLFTVPVYDYVLATAPLTTAQLDSIGWKNRQGVGDSANQFHYYRLTPDNRILWGGYDAIYYYGRSTSPAHDQRPETFELLASHFFETFPQLEDLTFSHRWGGAIDLCTRFCAFFGTGIGGSVAYALGYTGLGVGATRFGANVMLDLLAGTPTERTELEMVRSRPLPLPPEPLAYPSVQLTRRAIAKADRNEGRRGPYLRTLDKLGLGFDS
jgi:glycine/D-amino acid oxidase-like deaminating enzyme